ncbi:unknown (plasmid) [Halobacterium salinarum NRC-1]|uniref:Uncharacterized protein n=1 Tax=Halobacterium salinarum (strain ATCC 700922 / JCM 11081 / NRC-1) TaxID=64091 RepID=O52022_HALSA|nr:hypothetical protein [Halobacterium salinarum]AAC82902.1 unknown [Halobacterium salinarum NRC-1]
MPSEQACCEDYVTQRPEAYKREVVVGNTLLRDTDHITDGAEGPLAGSIDALHTPSDVGYERLVECKTSPTFRGLGQILLYTYFRRRDRELVRQQDNGQKLNWETTKEIKKDESHLKQEGQGTGRTVHAKPAIDEIQQVLAVCEIDSPDAPLLSAYTDLGVTVEHRTNGTWRTLNADVFDAEPSSATPPMMSWLERNSRDSLDSSLEEQLWEANSGVVNGHPAFVFS